MRMARERALFLSRVSSFLALAVVWLSSASSDDDDVAAVDSRDEAIMRPRDHHETT